MSDLDIHNNEPNQGAQGTFQGPVNINNYHGELPPPPSPPLPPHPPADFVPRLHEYKQLLDQLCGSVGDTVGITAAVALVGLGGFGKTTLAKALCHDERVQQAFPDGVLWIEIGQNPDNLLGKLENLVRYLTNTRERLGITLLNEAAIQLSLALAERQILLVIDDVWDAAHLQPFLEGDPRCTRLITTRLHHVLPPAAHPVAVDAMQANEAVDLLAWGLPLDAVKGNTAALKQIAQRLGEWPLLLKLANGVLRQRVKVARSPLEKALEYLNTALARRGLTAFDARTPQQREQAVELTIGISLDLLTEEQQARYAELAIFPEDVDVPLATVARLWDFTGGLDDVASEDLCVQLAILSLLLRCDLEQRTIRLHDVIRLYLQKQHGNLPALHTALLAAYRPSTGWHALAPDEPYLWQQLAAHLRDADSLPELEQLLADYRWLHAKLQATTISAVIADYDALRPLPEAHRHIRDALRLSAHILAQDPAQLAAQLHGRLLTFEQPAIRQLLADATAANAANSTAWLRPLHPCLTPPGGALIRTLSGHTGDVNSVAVLPDGKQALSAASDKTLKLWDLASGACLQTLSGHTGDVNSVAVLPDGKQALSASGDKTLKLWDLATGTCLRTFTGHSDGVWSVAILPDGRRALSVSMDYSLRLWDLQTGKCLRTFTGHSDGVWSGAILPDGQHALSASMDCTLKLWDLTTGECLRTFTGHSDGINSAAVLSDGQRALSASNDETLKLWDLTTGECLRTLTGHSDRVWSVAVLSDGQRALSASNDMTLKLWDLTTGECLRTFTGHSSSVRDVTVFSDGQRALSASYDHTLKLWDLASGACLQTLSGHTGWVNSVAVLPDGKQALSASHDNTLKLWDLVSGACRLTLSGHTGWVNSVAMLPDGKQALSASHDNTLKLWDLVSGACRLTLSGHTGWVNSVAMLPDGRQALSASHDNTLKLWDLHTGECLRTFTGHSAWIMDVAVFSDGQRALSASDDHTLKLWDLASGACLQTLSGHTDPVTSVAVLPDGKQALSADADGTLKLWDLASGACLQTLSGHTGWVTSVAVLPDGKQALSASHDNTLKLWDLHTGECLRTFTGHSAWIRDVAVFSDGQRALSASDDHTLKLWDLASGACRLTFSGENPFRCCALAADGRTAVAGDSEGGVFFLRLEGV